MRVTFPSVNPTVPRDMLDPAVRARTLHCPAELYLPKGADGPRPAVLVSEGLGGPKPVREYRYGELLASHGYVALCPNSFEPRGVARFGDEVRAMAVTTAMMLADAFAGLAFLAGHPQVRADAIHIIGFSYGGMVSVLCAYEQMRRLFAPDPALRFAGHASYYGSSVPRLEDPTTTGAPVLMMLAAKDRNVSPHRSHLIAEDLRRGGSTVQETTFEEAYHQWDGDDLTERFVRFNIADCCMKVLRDGTMLDEARGMRVTGRLSRLAFMAMNSSMKGYTILRNEDVLRQSDELLLDFLRRASTPELASPPVAGPVIAGRE